MIQPDNSPHEALMKEQEDSRGAIAHLLYLLNISFLPIIAFVLLLHLNRKTSGSRHSRVSAHFRQAIAASVISGILLLLVSALIMQFGQWDSPYTWMTLLIYFTCVHSALLLFGVFAWVKASNGEEYVYPLWGRFF